MSQIERDILEQPIFVTVMEKFDESMVLLADYLKWPLEDVSYLKMKQWNMGNRSVIYDIDKYQHYGMELQRWDALLYQMALVQYQVGSLVRGKARE